MARDRGVTGGSKIWTVRGIPPELQAAVSAAARAGRQTLGEWTAAALSSALGGGEPQSPPVALPDEGAAERLVAVEARLAALERVVEGLGHRTEGTQFRVDGLEQHAEALDRRFATVIPPLAQRLDALEARGMQAAPVPVAAVDEPPAGLFTRGVGSRKRLTAAGEEELQRLLAIGADDATIAARLGIHKRIVWARRLTEGGPD
jgi:hypothetical protein